MSLIDKVRLYGDLRASEMVEGEQGSGAEAERIAARAAALLAEIRAALEGSSASGTPQITARRWVDPDQQAGQPPEDGAVHLESGET